MKLSIVIHRLQGIQEIAGDDPDVEIELVIGGVPVRTAVENVLLAKTTGSWVRNSRIFAARVYVRGRLE
jgi:hypothetical protein